MIGLIGIKEGMSRVFTEDGNSVPVTVVKIDSNVVTQIKKIDSEGYSSVQISTGTKKEKHLTKPEKAHLNKSNTPSAKTIKEFRIQESDLENIELGQSLELKMFEEGQIIDVTGTTKGKGFAGTVKRWNFATQDATHGNSLAHRKPGSIGQCQTPGRVWKGKKMAGHLGNTRQTTQNLQIQKIDAENNLILVKGALPGSKGSPVIIKPATKN